MSIVISLLNQKGGSGKTTIATNLAVGLSMEGGKVLLVDSDPQGSSRDWRASSDSNSIPVIGLDRPSLLKGLAVIGKDYDIVILDGAPQIKELAVSAIRASDVILVPVQPSPYDIWAAADLVELIKTRQEITEGKLQAAFLVSRAIQNTRLSKDVYEALNHYSTTIFKSQTTQRVAYATSAINGESVFESDDLKAQEEIRSIIQELMQWVN